MAGRNYRVTAESTVTETFTVWAESLEAAQRIVEGDHAGEPDESTAPAVRMVLGVVEAEPEVFECTACSDSGVLVEVWNAGDGITRESFACSCAAGERFAAERMAGR
jgi:hypothetical protein